MKLGAVVAVGLVFAGAQRAHALIDIQLTNDVIDVTLPLSGSTTVQFMGYVDLTDGWRNDSTTVYNPFTVGLANSLSVNFDTAYVTWFSGSQSTNYTGAIFDVVVNSTSVAGKYFLGNGSPSGLAEIDAHGTDGTYSGTDNEFYEVNVSPAPEPSSMIALAAFGVTALVRRKRQA